jgi:beta-lactamase class A
MKSRSILAVIIFLAVFGCACAHGISNSQASIVQPASNPTVDKSDRKADELREQMAKYAKESRGKVGAAVRILETGQTVEMNDNDRYPMQSVYKFPIGMAVLNLVDTGQLDLDKKVVVEKSDLLPGQAHSPIRDKYPEGNASYTIRDLMTLMMIESDGTASDVLLRTVGGPDKVTAYLQSLGITKMVVATSEMEMTKGDMVQFLNWTTPVEAVNLLEHFYKGEGLSPASHDFLKGLMEASTTGPHRIKGQLPKGTVVAHKTGTSGTSNGLTHATNDIGIVTLPDGRHMAIAVFVTDSTANESTREGTIAKISKAAWEWATD